MTNIGTLTFEVNEQQIDKDVKHAILKYLTSRMPKVSHSSAERIKEVFRRLILGSGTIQSLGGGKLQWEFGFDNIKARIDDLINEWIESLKIDSKSIKTTSSGLSGGFTITMVQANWSDVIDSESAIFVTPEHKYHLRWLEWLLIEGGKAVVAEYDFVEKGGLGRLGHGTMIKNVKRKRWSVPSEFQGTTNANFVTEVIDKIYSILPVIFIEEFNRAL